MNSSLGLARSDFVVVGQVSIITERLLPEVRRWCTALPLIHGGGRKTEVVTHRSRAWHARCITRAR